MSLGPSLDSQESCILTKPASGDPKLYTLHHVSAANVIIITSTGQQVQHASGFGKPNP